jgi:peptide subunit release factor 1 (eRF1)
MFIADYLRREYLVVLADSHRARLYIASPSGSRLLDELEESVPKTNRSSGQRWGKQQATIARHREDHILHFQLELVECVELAYDARSIHGIILLGEHEVLESIHRLMPKRLAQCVVHEAPHSWSGRQPEIRERVREVVRGALNTKLQRLIREINGRIEQGAAVASGPQEVIVALRNGQISEIIMGPDLGDVGSRCVSCGSLFAFEESNCSFCKAHCDRCCLWQEIITQAVHHGIDVHFVPRSTEFNVPGGVSALLARDDPQWAPCSDNLPK